MAPPSRPIEDEQLQQLWDFVNGNGNGNGGAESMEGVESGNIDDFQFGSGNEGFFGSPSDVFGSNAFESNAADASNATQAPAPSTPNLQSGLTFPQVDSAPPASTPDRQPGLALPQVDPALHGSSTVQDPFSTGQDLASAFTEFNLPQYPSTPLLGQDNGNNRAATRQESPYGNPSSSSPFDMPSALPSGGQFGMYSNMQQQPQQAQQQLQQHHRMTYGNDQPISYRSTQTFGPQSFNYQGSVPQHLPLETHMSGQGYPMTPAQGSMAPNPFQPRFPVLNQPAQQPPHPPVPQPPVAQPGQANQPNQALLGDKIHHKRNRRHEAASDASRFYTKPTGLGPWGPLVGARAKAPLFQYYQTSAELRPGIMLTKDQLVTFMRGSGHPSPNRQLTLWIQNTAAQVNERYAGKAGAAKCRFKDCPAGSNTILKGFYRVAFDEFSDQTGTVLDPFQLSGYMHLHCFESIFDLGYLVHHGAARLGFRVLPDERNLPYESRNPASITRDHKDMANAYKEWVASQKARVNRIEELNWAVPPAQRYTGLDPGPRNILPHAQRLGCFLVDKHLSLQVKGRALARAQRGGIHIGIHKGNLDLLEQRKRQNLVAKKKHDARLASEEDEDEEEERPRKRTRQTRSTSSPLSVTSSPPPAPQNKGKKRDADSMEDSIEVVRSPKRTRQEQDDDDLFGNPWANHAAAAATTTASSSSPFGQPANNNNLYNNPPSQPRPRTRKRSREMGEEILTQLTHRQHLTRASAHAIQSQLGAQPAHVQDQVLAAVPAEYAALVLPRNGALHDDRLAQRIGSLSQRQRREVEVAVGKQEKLDGAAAGVVGGKKKGQSI
ncbi:hypothetical protein C8A00DRAFT_37946 [Chaetomidium leptoderma]|uniref:Uncharacterized protein n=1 Tax=Chaetomidium leptoderma TaxID=669021 RepID=A0AAN6VDI6_9PEZI|nr:hypothetical protein C8A00DRAFT_37946 [Chaetomidium leptoderma]